MVEPGATGAEIGRPWPGNRFDSVADVAVCDGHRLLGLIRLEDLLAAPGAATAGQLMDRDPPVVAPGADQEAAAWKAIRHGQSSVAVIDDDGARLEMKRGLQGSFVGYVVINAFLIGVWATTGGGYFWPGWVLAGWGVAQVLGVWTYLLGPITEAEVDEELRRMT